MTKYLISFPAAAMEISREDCAAVGEASHAVIREAKDAGVYVFWREALNDQVHYDLLERPESGKSRALDIHKRNGRNGRRTDAEHG